MSTPVKKVPIHLQSAQNRLVIKNGKIINDDEVLEQDVYIEDGIIKQIGRNLIIPGGTRVIDARGRYVMPGGVDPHTHFEFNFLGTTTVDDFYQGTKAAVAGGTTTIIDFVFAEHGENLLDAFNRYRTKADDKVCCDYGLHVILSTWSDHVKEDMKILCTQLGVNSFKMFMAFDFMLNDFDLYSAMENCKALGALPLVHAENGLIIAKNVAKLKSQGLTGPDGHALSRPESVEAEATNRACVIAQQAECPLYIVHVMSKSAALVIKQNKESGVQVYGETLTAALGTDGSHYTNKSFEHSAGHVLSPPLRSDATTPQFLMNFLSQDILQATGSDHCTFSKSQKEVGLGDFTKIPDGVNGVEERMSIIWEKGVHAGVIDPCRFVSITSTNAAKLFNLYPRKGCIAVGSDADIVIWNPSKTCTISAKTHHSSCDFNIFEGMECHGIPEYVVVNGRVCVDEEKVRAVQGHGRYLEMPCFAPYIFEPEKLEEMKAPKNGTINEIELHNKLTKIELDPKICITPTLPDSAISTPSCRGPRPEGQRNIQDSTFSISEELDLERKSCIKVRNPPGGKSSGFW